MAGIDSHEKWGKSAEQLSLMTGPNRAPARNAAEPDARHVAKLDGTPFSAMPDPAQVKPLSRLEKLRLESQERAKAAAAGLSASRDEDEANTPPPLPLTEAETPK